MPDDVCVGSGQTVLADVVDLPCSACGRKVLAELYRHDANNYGPWTMGMKRRVRTAAGLD